MGRARRPRTASRSRVTRITIAASAGPSLWTPGLLRSNGLELWLDAGDGSTITADEIGLVQQWRDKSGFARHASQSNPADSPLYSATGWRGSKPALLFGSATSEFMVSANFGVPAQAWDFFAVYRHDHTAIATHGFLRNNAGTTIVPIGWQSDVSTNVFRVNNTNDPAGLEAYRNGSATPLSRTRANFFDKLTTVESPNGMLVRYGALNWTVSTAIERIGNNGSWGVHGPICEIVAVSSVISAADKQRIEGYLAHKWMTGIELAAGHPYRNEPPRINS